MTRWSLRRHRHRAQQPVPGTVRLDPVRPELEPASGGFRPDGGYAPGMAAGYAGAQPGMVPPGHFYPGAGHPGAAPQTGFPPSGFPQPGFPETAFAQHGLLRDADGGRAPAGGAWPEVMERFGLHLLTLAEQLRISLDELEADEADPERLQKLYKVDHAVTRMRRASLDLRTLAGRAHEELSGIDTSILDVIRMALSAIDRYTQVTIGKVTDFAVLGYAADDVASLLAALLDNATRYSPGVTTVSAHLTEGGSVLLRIEDSGIGMNPDGVADLNAMLAGDVPELDDRTGRHTGFPVVHRIARKYSIGVRLAARAASSGGGGTIALVTVPPELLCELPEEPYDFPAPPPAAAPAAPRAREGSVSVLPSVRREPPPPPSGTTYSSGEAGQRAFPVRVPGASMAAPQAARANGAHAGEPAEAAPAAPAERGAEAAGGLPRREPGSLRGGKPRSGAAGSGPGDQGPGGAAAAPGRSAEEQAASRRAFADDLTAFSSGSASASEPQDSSGKGTPS